MTRPIRWTVAALVPLLGPLAGCLETTRRTVPRGPQAVSDELPDPLAPNARSPSSHGLRAAARGALVTLPDVPAGALVHRSGVTFPEQVGAFRRVRAYRAEDGSGSSAEYGDGSGRVRIVASVGDRAGASAAARYEQVRAELESAGRGALPPAGADPDAPALAGSTPERADQGERQLLTSYRVEAVGPDFLEYRATYPASRRQAAVEAFDRFRSDHSGAK